MIRIEFCHSEVIEFLRLYSLFENSLSTRIQTLIETGDISDESPIEAAKQKYNRVFLDNFYCSVLIKNSYLEEKVKEITGNDIIIIDHDDNTITGTSCIACNYIVFESKEDSFYEICPVCGWQNDGKKGDEYSGCNHSTLNEYKNTSEFKNKIVFGNKIYVNNNLDD